MSGYGVGLRNILTAEVSYVRRQRIRDLRESARVKAPAAKPAFNRPSEGQASAAAFTTLASLA